MDWINANLAAWDRMRRYFQGDAVGQIAALYLIAAQAAGLAHV